MKMYETINPNYAPDMYHCYQADWYEGETDKSIEEWMLNKGYRMVFINKIPATDADVMKLVMEAYSSTHTQNPVIIKAKVVGPYWYYTTNK